MGFAFFANRNWLADRGWFGGATLSVVLNHFGEVLAPNRKNGIWWAGDSCRA